MTKKPQIDKFREAARQIGADDDETRFNEKLGQIARHRPDPDRLAKLMDDPKNLEEIAKELGNKND